VGALFADRLGVLALLCDLPGLQAA